MAKELTAKIKLQCPAGQATLIYDGPEAPKLPAAGRQMVTEFNHTWQGFSWLGTGTTYLRLNPPDDWR